MSARVIAVERGLLGKNAELAARLRERFTAGGTLVVNILSSPGSGKTALLERTLADLGPQMKMGVIVGDLATDNDARRLRRPGVEVVQITTGNVCHLEAGMIERAWAEMAQEGMRILFIENVGNLVCPASYDLGEAARVVLLSVTEGEDKPLKYPKMFKTANAIAVTKTDIAEAARFERATALENLRLIAPQATVFELSARTGTGLTAWYEYLLERR